jgi:hypothetical protein
MDREERVDRIAATNVAPGRKDAKENKGAQNRAATNVAAAPSRWIRNVNDYHRRQPREFQVTRFG